MKYKPKPGEISISIQHRGAARFTAHYAFPDFDLTECAFDELRAVARSFTELAAKGRHACSIRHPLGLSSCGVRSTIRAMRAFVEPDPRKAGRRR